jgi:ATP/maltotriose-dependent transcriptional regulator MalT
MRRTPLPLVGREKAAAVLREAIAATAGGSGGSVVIEGPAGIGKSRLLAEAESWARPHGLAVAAGRATVLDRVVPLTTLLTALRSGEPPVFDRTALDALDGHEFSRYRLIDRLCRLVEDYSRVRPLAIVVDDVQWADELTALALRVMIPTLRSRPVLWLLARRPLPTRTAASDTMEWLVGQGTRTLQLEPLDEAATREFCAGVLGTEPGPSVLALAAGCGGNPFLLAELLTTLRAEGRIHVAAKAAHATTGALPGDFVAAVDQRLRELSPDTLRLLEAASVLGRPFSVAAVAGLLHRPAVELLAATREAVSAGALDDHGNTLVFQHDLIREAVYDKLSGPVRQALHLEAATVLRAEGRPAAEVVAHFLRGTQRAEASALPMFREAVAQVAPTAPGAAADLVLRMINLLDRRDPARLRLVGDGVRLLAAAGRVAEARQLGETYLSCGLDAASESAIMLGLAEALKHAGQDRLVTDYTRRGLALDGVSAEVRAELLAVRAHALLQVDDVAGADAAGTSAVELGHASDTHSAVVSGGAARSMVAYARGELGDAIKHARDAVVVAASVGGDAGHRHPRLWLARALVATDKLAEADSMYLADKYEADELGTVWSRPLAHQFHAELKVAAGQLAEAAAEAEAGVRVAEELSAMALVPALLATLAQVAVYRGDTDAAGGYLTRARQHIRDGICVMTEELSWELAMYQDAVGQHSAAFDTIGALYEDLYDRPYLLVQEPAAAPKLVGIALRAQADAEAQAVVRAAERLATRNPGVASLTGSARHAAGLLHRDLATLRAAVAAHRDGPRPLCRAHAMEDTGVAEHAAGDRAAAIALLDEANAIYQESGARRDAARVHGLLLAVGARGATGQERRRARTGWPSLTRSELRVVRLVAEGRTNREVADQLFLSPHTVDSHIRHAFAKLNVSSRVGLTRLVLTHDRDG